MTPIVPAGATSGSRLSITRMGLSALVSMTRTNSSVVTSAIVCVGSFVVPFHEQQVEQPARQPAAQCGELIGLVDVEDLDLHPTCALVGEIVQPGARAAAANGADDVPPFVQELRGHGVAQPARRADEQDRAGKVG
ncbi:MAG: hypothetical protein WAS21_06535 [Geminicoccaceae bacterium]